MIIETELKLPDTYNYILLYI